MKKVTKAIIIIISILFTVYLSISIYKFCIIHKIQTNDKQNMNSKNYYFSEKFDGDNSSKEYYFKDGKFNYIYTSQDRQKKYVFGDKEKTYTIDENGETIEQKEYLNFFNSYPSLIEELPDYKLDTIKGQILFALSFKTKISSADQNNKKCYKITYDSKLDIYIEKDNCTLVRVFSEPIFSNDGDAIMTSSRNIEVKFNVVKDTDVIPK